jgi:hypothetical protein
VAALSFKSEVNIETIHPLIDSDRLRTDRRVQGRQTKLVKHDDDHSQPAGVPPATKQELEQGLEVFQAVSLSVAQWTIRYGADRIAAKMKKPSGAAVA